MSLFKEPFDERIVTQLDKRQEIIGKDIRSSQDIAYLNSKTAWVKLRSSVDYDGAEVPSGTAKGHILLGGRLHENGNRIKNMISNKKEEGNYDYETHNNSTKSWENNLLGLRPMPGITDISIQSKSAYGSLRQATVNFQCWDVEQLNILETLYMRPGYTVLLEWGWTPYIDNEGLLVDYIEEDKKFFERKNIDIQKYLSELREIALDSYGNYDAMFGYIKNYSWKLRLDGGYDCMTEIISTGEVLESFKLNYSGTSISTNSAGTLLSTIQYDEIENIQKEYRRNALAGLLAETYALVKNTSGNETSILPSALSSFDPTSNVVSYTATNGKTGTIYYATKEIELEKESWLSTDSEANDGKEANQGFITDDDSNIYITLRSFVELLNNFILLENPDSSEENKNIIKLSVDDRPDSVDAGQPLHCLYNPLQISVDPRVCIIKNDLFEPLIQGINIVEENQGNVETVQTISSKATAEQFEPIIKQLKDIRANDSLFGGKEQEFKNVLSKINTKEKLAGISDYYYNKYGESFYSFLTNGGFVSSDLNAFSVADIFSGLNITQEDIKYFENDLARKLAELSQQYTTTLEQIDVIEAFTDVTPAERKKRAIESAKNRTEEQKETLDEAKEEINSSEEGYLSFCNKLSQAYHTNDANIKYGVHGNIFLNLRMLYNLAGSEELEGQDPAEKQTISLMSYMKDMLTMVQNSIGNVNNFEVIIDGNVGYIVDVNNVPSDNRPNFIFSINEKDSIIKNISLESQIFSDQSTIIAVAAQSDAGKLGLENSSMVAYNAGVKDRNIFRKEPSINSKKTFNDELQGFVTALYDLSELFNSMDKMLGFFDSELIVDSIPKYKKSLTDIIVFFTSYYSAPNKYRALLPTKLSLTTDGIGGLIIGNKFSINSEYVPRTYQGDNSGFDLSYIITNIKQEVNNSNQWNTTIEANPSIDDIYADQLNNNGKPIDVNLTIIKKYIYDQSTGNVTEQLSTNNSRVVNDPPPGVTGNVRLICLAMNATLQGYRLGTSECNRYTYAIAKKYTKLLKNPNTPLDKGVKINESGGDAAKEGALQKYEQLGYKRSVIGTGLTKAEMEKWLSNTSVWNVGEVATYHYDGNGGRWSKPNHAQIYTGRVAWDPTANSYVVKAGASLWTTDDSSNYKESKGGTGNFIYHSKSQNSYTLYRMYL